MLAFSKREVVSYSVETAPMKSAGSLATKECFNLCIWYLDMLLTLWLLLPEVFILIDADGGRVFVSSSREFGLATTLISKIYFKNDRNKMLDGIACFIR